MCAIYICIYTIMYKTKIERKWQHEIRTYPQILSISGCCPCWRPSGAHPSLRSLLPRRQFRCPSVQRPHSRIYFSFEWSTCNIEVLMWRHDGCDGGREEIAGAVRGTFAFVLFCLLRCIFFPRPTSEDSTEAQESLPCLHSQIRPDLGMCT